MSTRSRKLLRQFKKLLESEDAEARLLALALRLKQFPDAEWQNDARLLELFPQFFEGIDASYTDLEFQAKLATRNLELGSNELSEANQRLATLNLSINAMLDALGQGLFFFDATGLCSPVYSRACLPLLECEPAGKHVSEVLKTPERMQGTMESLVQLLFSGNHALSPDEVFALFPGSIPHSQGFNIAITYQPMFDAAGILKSVLVIATDRTQETAAIALIAEREREALLTLRISRNRNYFVRFLLQASHFFSALDELPGTVVQMKRDIHTFKGTASTFQLADFATALQYLEDSLKDTTTPAMARGILEKKQKELLGHLDSARGIARPILGDDFEKTGVIRALPADTVKVFAQKIVANVPPGLAREFFTTFMADPIHGLLVDFDVSLRELADRYGKPLKPCIFEGQDVQILSEIYQPLLCSLVHVQRNIVDHALQDSDTREALGKPREATVRIATRTFTEAGQEWLEVLIVDDGRGIDPAALRRKLESRMPPDVLAAKSDEDVLQEIFSDDVSTAAPGSDLSGRGVGMSAVKHEAALLGGTARVSSILGQSTTLTIRVPLLWELKS